LQASVQEKELAAGTRQQEAVDALASLKALVESVDLDADDSTILQPLVERGQKLRVVETEGKATRDAAKREVDALDAALVPRRKTLGDRQERLVAGQKTLTSRERATETQRTSIPGGFRPDVGAATSEIEALLKRLQARLTSLRDIGRDHSAAAKRREQARKTLTQLDREQAEKVDTPQQLSSQRLAVLADRMAEGGGVSAVAAAPPPGTPLADKAVWATTLEDSVRLEVGNLERQSASAADTASRARAGQEAILVNAGFGDLGTLEKALASATGEAEAAAVEEQKALAQVPMADDLDRRLGPARELRDALSELARLLSDGKFVGFVVERRQRTLLVVASEILKSMTRQRYAFAENFRIIDLITSQARPVETLSGGEQFLASLSLALGLVELAGRSGGRVDSLILDEGFASLDTSALADALDELACRAGAGKLVALVSHLGAVADAAPEVLYVLQKDGSSVARWRTESRDDPELDAVDARLHRA
jgi:exonuclease SbcC